MRDIQKVLNNYAARLAAVVLFCIGAPLLAANGLTPASPLGGVSGAAAAAGGGGSGTVSAGTSPFVAYYTGATTVSSTSALQFPGAEVVVNETGSGTMDFRVEGDTLPNLLFVDASADRVGIGTSTPAVQFAVRGAGNVQAEVQGTGTANSGEFVVGNSTDVTYIQSEVYGSTAAGTLMGYNVAGSAFIQAATLGTGANQNFYILSANDNTDIVFANGIINTPEKMRLKFGAGVVFNENGGSTNDLRVEGDTDANLIFADASVDYVGIGTATPSSKLNVAGASVLDGANRITIGTVDTTALAAGVGSGISFAGVYTGGGAVAGWAGIKSVKENATSGDFAAGMAFMTRPNGGNNTEYLRLTSAGRFGIKTSTPGSTLDVDNLAVAESSFIARDNGTPVFTIADGGALTSTGGITFSGVTTDIAATAGENLRLAATGAGAIEMTSGTNSFNLLTSTAVAGARIDSSTTTSAFLGQTIGFLGSVSGKVSFEVAAVLGDTATTALFTVLGSGLIKHNIEQTVSCAAGVASLAPTSTYVTVDANGASCVVTIAETNFATIGTGVPVIINVMDLGGAFVVTFPDVANVFDGPTLCTTTGLAENGTMQMMYVNKADDMFVATACTNNL